MIYEVWRQLIEKLIKQKLFKIIYYYHDLIPSFQFSEKIGLGSIAAIYWYSNGSNNWLSIFAPNKSSSISLCYCLPKNSEIWDSGGLFYSHTARKYSSVHFFSRTINLNSDIIHVFDFWPLLIWCAMQNALHGYFHRALTLSVGYQTIKNVKTEIEFREGCR